MIIPCLAFTVYWYTTGATDAPYGWLWLGFGVLMVAISVFSYIPYRKAYPKK